MTSTKDMDSSKKVGLLSDDSLAGTEAENTYETGTETGDADNGSSFAPLGIEAGEEDDAMNRQKKASFVIAATPLEEAKIISKILLLVSMSMIFELGPQIIGNIFVGHLYDSELKDDEMLSAVGLGTTFVFITGVAVTWGFTTALYTLVPQAMGHENQDEINLALRIYTQRAILVTSCVAAPLLVLQCFAGDVMVAIGQPEYLKSRITRFAITMIPYVVSMTYLSILQRLGQPLDLNFFLMALTLGGTVASIPVMYVLMYPCGVGYLGAGIAQSVVTAGMVLITVLYMIRKGYGFLFKPLPWSVVAKWSDLKEYIALSLPGLVQNGFEWWIMEIAIVLAGYIGENDDSEERTTAISGAVIMYNLFLIIISFGYGVANSVNIRVAKYIGSKHIPEAKMAAKVGFVVSSAVCVVAGIVFASLNDFLPLIWTHNPDTDELVSKLCYVFIFFQFFLLQSQFWGGLYRGVARQKKSAVFVVIGYYVLCLPALLIVLFALKVRRDLLLGSVMVWGLLGAGNMVAVILCGIYFVTKIDFASAMDESHRRIKRTLDSASVATKNPKEEENGDGTTMYTVLEEDV